MKKQNTTYRNLAEYYYNLPDSFSPKSDFLAKVVVRCGVSMNTARNWVLGYCKPSEPEHIEILADITGISKDKLFAR